MPKTRMRIEQIDISPEVPLNRKGCEVESALCPQSKEGWGGTCFTFDDTRDPSQVINLFKEYGEDIFFILKQFELPVEKRIWKNKPLTEIHKEIIGRLEGLKVIKGGQTELKLNSQDEVGVGSIFELLVADTLNDLRIQALTSVKVKYPYNDLKYDPDGQLYDVIGGFDLSKLLWVECKKPLYLTNANPLKSNNGPLSKKSLGKFYNRAWWLKPDIAIYLVDTTENYIELLKKTIIPEYANKYCSDFLNGKANQIIARLDGFIYFCRIEYRENKNWYKALKQAVSQVLHDARFPYIENRFNKNPFTGEPYN